jgi:hypothetical protein
MKIKLLVAILGILCLLDKSTASETGSLSLPVIICGKIEGSHGDTLSMYYYHNYMEKMATMPITQIVTDNRGFFFFRLEQPRTDFGWLNLFIKNKSGEETRIIDSGCPVEGGDSIFAAVSFSDSGYDISYSGIGWQKFDCYRKIVQGINSFVLNLETKLNIKDQSKEEIFDSLRMMAFCKQADSFLKDNIFMSPCNNTLTTGAYKVLLAEFAGMLRLEKLYKASVLLSHASQTKNKVMRRQAHSIYEMECKYIGNEAEELPILSDGYMDYVLFYYNDKFSYIKHPDSFLKTFSLPEIYAEVKKSYKGKAKNYVLMWVLKTRGAGAIEFSSSLVLDSLWQDLFRMTKKGPLKNYIADKIGHSSTGSKEYDFAMPDTRGKITRLSDFKGKVVLIDIWFTGCGSCIDYNMRMEQDFYPHFLHDTNIVFLSVCGDIDRQRWLKSVAAGGYTNSKSINLYTGGLGFGHPFMKYYNFNGGPNSLLIDKKGRIADGSPTKVNIPLLESIVRRVMNE